MNIDELRNITKLAERERLKREAEEEALRLKEELKRKEEEQKEEKEFKETVEYIKQQILKRAMEGFYHYTYDLGERPKQKIIDKLKQEFYNMKIVPGLKPQRVIINYDIGNDREYFSTTLTFEWR